MFTGRDTDMPAIYSTTSARSVYSPECYISRYWEQWIGGEPSDDADEATQLSIRGQLVNRGGTCGAHTVRQRWRFGGMWVAVEWQAGNSARKSGGEGGGGEGLATVRGRRNGIDSVESTSTSCVRSSVLDAFRLF